MGSQSFGKGSVQQQKPLGDGTAIHITIARYYTPSGRSIQNEGITPDIEVLQSKVEVLEKKQSTYSEASFKNSLKNDAAQKKQDAKKKADADGDTAPDLTDAEKDALDYQLQRGMDMVRAMAKLAARPAPDATDGVSDDADASTDNAAQADKKSDTKSDKAKKSDKK